MTLETVATTFFVEVFALVACLSAVLIFRLVVLDLAADVDFDGVATFATVELDESFFVVDEDAVDFFELVEIVVLFLTLDEEDFVELFALVGTVVLFLVVEIEEEWLEDITPFTTTFCTTNDVVLAFEELVVLWLEDVFAVDDFTVVLTVDDFAVDFAVNDLRVGFAEDVFAVDDIAVDDFGLDVAEDVCFGESVEDVCFEVLSEVVLAAFATSL